MPSRVNPSILAADFAAFASEVARIPSADFVHADVMDNHFVPNLTFGLPMVQRLAEVAPIPLDVHLMIEDPDRWAPEYAAAAAPAGGYVTFHAEAAHDAIATAAAIRQAGAKAGLALRPGTAATPWLEHLDAFDQILVMTVEPGFGGQAFQPAMLTKVAEVRRAVGSRSVLVQVDGGIGETTIRDVAEAGADTFVAGSAVFGAADPDQAVHSLRRLAEAAAPRHAH